MAPVDQVAPFSCIGHNKLTIHLIESERSHVLTIILEVKETEEMDTLLLYVIVFSDLAVDPVKTGSLPHHKVVMIGRDDLGHLIEECLELLPLLV